MAIPVILFFTGPIYQLPPLGSLIINSRCYFSICLPRHGFDRALGPPLFRTSYWLTMTTSVAPLPCVFLTQSCLFFYLFPSRFLFLNLTSDDVGAKFVKDRARRTDGGSWGREWKTISGRGSP